jgi:lipoprotein-anchoring transpeptidase ErfK/SrfK
MLSPTVLKGEIQADGKREYETRVSYWMRMTWAGHGFHDATWQPWFGGDRYTYAGSHGCINMSYYEAQELYGILEVGTPVISHF